MGRLVRAWDAAQRQGWLDRVGGEGAEAESDRSPVPSRTFNDPPHPPALTPIFGRSPVPFGTFSGERTFEEDGA